MISKKELLVLSYLRKDARQNLTKISRSTGIPVSTIFDKIKKYEGGLIKKNTAIIDFSKLGYEMKVNIVIKIPKDEREKFQEFLMKRDEINSIYRINNGYDFLVEALFRNMKEVNDFMEDIDQYKIKAKEYYYVLDEIKREAFMSKPELVNLL